MCRLYNNQEMRPAAGKQITKCVSANVARLLPPENSKSLESNSDVESMIVQANTKDAITVAGFGLLRLRKKNIDKRSNPSIERTSFRGSSALLRCRPRATRRMKRWLRFTLSSVEFLVQKALEAETSEAGIYRPVTIIRFSERLARGMSRGEVCRMESR
jgi:hypothetical protein